MKNKGNVLSILGKYTQALELYDEAIKIHPNFPAAFTNKGNALYGLGNYKEAEKCYEDAIRMIQGEKGGVWHPKNEPEVKVMTYLHLALTKYNTGHTEAALDILDKNLDDKKI